jgi:hypothetical protein
LDKPVSHLMAWYECAVVHLVVVLFPLENSGLLLVSIMLGNEGRDK